MVKGERGERADKLRKEWGERKSRRRKRKESGGGVRKTQREKEKG